MLKEKPGNLVILASQIPGMCETMSVESLALSHASWDKVCRQFSPWRLIQVDNTIFWQGKSNPMPCPTVICGPCSSSMDVGRRLWENGLIREWTGVLAVSQRAGRGRKRRAWHSPSGNLYANWIWPKPKGFPETLIPLAVCLEIVRLLESLGLNAAIKWPNDILVDAFKIGGILVEETHGELMVGIGLNVNCAPPRSLLAIEGSLPSICLLDLGIQTDLIEIWSGIVQTHLQIIDNLHHTQGRMKMIQEAEKRLAGLGGIALICSSGDFRDGFHAVILGISDDGGLRIEKEGRMMTIRSCDRALPLKFLECAVSGDF
jgi:BirA family biotin operon repressor/biotin-[acetyl-CoA-carboxylase] ligase